jgi:5,10-methylenetetrahydromethanopterin reductase
MKFTVGIIANAPITQSLEWAKQAEEFGFDSLGFTEDMMFKSGWPLLFLASQVTSRINLGVTLSNPNTTHPAILATYTAMLDEASGGRAFMCMGRGHLEVLKSMLNVVPPRPLAGLGEAVAFCKRLWRKDPTPFNGQVFFGTEEAVFNFDPIRPNIPILVGAWGPKAAETAGAEADGLLSWGVWNTPYIKRLQGCIAAGAERKGRSTDNFSLDLEPIFHIDEDEVLAKDRARDWLAPSIPILAPVTDFIDPDLRARMCDAIAAHDLDTAKSLISDEILEEFCLYGTPHQIIEKIERKQSEVGLNAISFGLPFETDRITNYMHLAGKYVIPHFKAKSAISGQQ